MIKKINCFIYIALFFLVPVVFGQSDVPDVVTGYKRVAQSGMGFLALPVGGRAASLGDAFNGAKGDVLSLFHNPAGISFIEKSQFMFSETYWLIDTKLHAGALAYPFKNWGTFGISFMSMDYGTFHGTQVDATHPLGWSETGDFEVGEFAVGIGFARRVTSSFAVGVQVKYIHQDLGESGFYEAKKGERKFISSKKNIVAADLGLIYDTDFKGISLSMSMRNFGTDVQYQLETFELPLIFKVGLSTTLKELTGLKSEVHDFTLFIDAVHPNDWSERVYLGGEYSFQKILFLRAGYKFNHSAEGLTLGAGVNVNVFGFGKASVDYAYKDTRDSGFEGVHVVSLNGSF